MFHINPSTTFRIRFIRGIALSPITLGIEDHEDFRIMAADGRYTKPFSVRHIQVGSGQRFDILLRTKSTAELAIIGRTSFWIQLETRYRPTRVTLYALLQSPADSPSFMESFPLGAPLNLPEDVFKWLKYSFEPLTPNQFPSAVKVIWRIFLVNDQIRDGIKRSINNRTWSDIFKREPYLFNIYNHDEAAIPSYDNAIKYGG